MSLSGRLSRVAGKFQRGRLIGSGSFGHVYSGTNLQTGEQVAMKVEPLASKMHLEASLTKRFAGEEGIPKVHWYGVEGNKKVMVMNLLGPSLEQMFDVCGRVFGLKFVLSLADQLLSRVETLHRKGVIHRDIKPDQFLVSNSEGAGPVHIIDLNLSRLYVDPLTGKHIPYKVGDDETMGTGTASFASMNSHFGIERSRRDDLEAVGYTLVYFMKGKLPWQGLSGKKCQIKEVKVATPLDELCQDLPSQFLTYLEYCRGLSFEETPDYDYLRGLFRDLLVETTVDEAVAKCAVAATPLPRKIRPAPIWRGYWVRQ